jgi:hypothetical protein
MEYLSHLTMAMSSTELLRRINRLGRCALPGTLVEVLVRCGTPSCACHRDPSRRHGPHLYLKYKSPQGRSTGMYVPRTAEAELRRGVAAWAELWQTMVQLGHRNREALQQRLRRRGDGSRG